MSPALRRTILISIVALTILVIGVFVAIRIVASGRINNLWEKIQSAKTPAESLRICETFLEKEEHPAARYFLGRLLREQGEFRKAWDELDKAVNRGVPEAHYERGLIVLELYRVRHMMLRRSREDAEGDTLTAEGVDVRFPNLQDLRDQARDDLAELTGPTVWMPEADFLYARAEHQWLVNHVEDARGALRKLEDPRARVALARIARDEGRFMRAAELAPDTPAGRIVRCEALLAQGTPDDSALRPEDDSEAAHLLRGLIAFRAGAWSASAESFRKVLQFNPRNHDAYDRRGQAHLRLGEIDKAVRDFTRAVAWNGEIADYHYHLGEAFRISGEREEKGGGDPRTNYSKAINAYASAIRRRERFYKALNAVALTHGHMGRYEWGAQQDPRGSFEKAITRFGEAIRLDPRHAETFNNRGFVYQMIGDYRRNVGEEPKIMYLQSLNDLTRALEIKPDFPVALHTRGYSYYHLKEFAKAVADWTRAVELEPSMNRELDPWIRRAKERADKKP